MKNSALAIWFLAAAVLIAANSYVCYFNVRKITESVSLVSKARDIIFAADSLLSSLKDAETGQRGYLITGKAEYLKPYEEAVAQVDQRLEGLMRQVATEADERERAASLRQVVADKLSELRQTIDIRRQEGFAAAQAIVMEDRGRHSMDSARGLVEQIRQAEQRGLLRYSEQREESVHAATATLLGAGIFNLFLLGMIAWVVRRDAASREREAIQIQRKLEVERDNVRLVADVEERRRANETLTALTHRLEQSNRELQDFASVASHDLQEPLRKIQAFGDRLRNGFAAALGGDGRDYVDRMHAAAARMQNLINDLLSFSRVTTQAQPFVELDLNRIVTEVLSDLESRIESSEGRVEVGRLPTLRADATQMRQLFQNLIANALKFSKKGVPPRVEISAAAVSTEHMKDAWEIRIKDNGIGFDEKYLDRIFNVFQRLHSRGEYEGTGIGLAVCRKIVERHGGQLTAQSREQEGATFVITLPANEGEKRDAEPSEADRHPVG